MSDAGDIAARVARFEARRDKALARAAQVMDGRESAPVLPDVMTPDHPLARALGFDLANSLVDNPARRRKALAEHRRDEVARLSLSDMPVAKIAAELGVTYSRVIQLRTALGLTKRRI